MAIILAVTAALAYFYILTRPEFPDGTFTVVIDGEEIKVVSEPDMAVTLLDLPPQVQQPALPEVTVSPDNGQGGGDGEVTTIPVTPINPTPIPVTPVQPTPIPVTPVQPTLLPVTIPPTAIPRPPQVLFENYQVVQGDTLFRITTKRNTTIALMARYGIDATDIIPGDVIRLPVANPAFCPGTTPYIVEEGDTLSSIALKCGTTIQNLKQINGFGDNFRLDVTQVMCVPNQS